MTALLATRRDIARRRPHMPAGAQGFASNLIEQTDNLIKRPEDAERLRPWMAESMRRLRAALST